MAGVKNTVNTGKIIHALQVKVRRLLMGLAAAVEGAYRTEVRDQGGVYTGTMIGTIAGTRLPTTGGVMAVQVGTPIEWGAYYEWGTKPHLPPFAPIRRWVELKIQPHVLAVGVSFESGRALPTKKGTKRLTGDKRQSEIMRIARRIQLSIQAKGTRPHQAMGNALASLGVPFAIVEEGGAKIYRIDAAAWMAKTEPNLWQGIMTAAQGAT